MATTNKKGISAGLVLLALVVLYLIFGRSKASAGTSSAGISGSTVNANPVIGRGGLVNTGKSVAAALGYTPQIAMGEDEGYTTDINIANDTNYPADQGASYDPSTVSIDPADLVSR